MEIEINVMLKDEHGGITEEQAFSETVRNEYWGTAKDVAHDLMCDFFDNLERCEYHRPKAS